jgi:hypothetical protein
VFAFDLFIAFVVFVVFFVFFVFIPVSRLKSRESVKIGPHPRGHPLIIWYQQLLVATDLLSFVISTINFKNPKKNSPKLPRILISRFVEFFVVLLHRFDVLGVDLHCLKISSPNSSYFARNHRFSLPISTQIDERLAQNFLEKDRTG